MLTKFFLKFQKNMYYDRKKKRMVKLYRDTNGSTYIGTSKWNAKLRELNESSHRNFGHYKK